MYFGKMFYGFQTFTYTVPLAAENKRSKWNFIHKDPNAFLWGIPSNIKNTILKILQGSRHTLREQETRCQADFPSCR